MKNIFSLVFLFFSFNTLFSMPVLNPADPALLDKSIYFSTSDNWGIKLGYRGDFVFNRHFRNEQMDMANFEIYANQVVLALTLWDRVDIYGFGGPASYNFHYFSIEPAHYIQGKSSSQTLWGSGLKVIVFKQQWSNNHETYMSLDGQYEGMSTNPLKWVLLDNLIVDTNNFGYYYREAQLSFGLAHKIKKITPYIAAKWSNGRLSINHEDIIGNALNTVTLDKLRCSRHWGYVIGISYVEAEKILITAEARFIDESALSIAFSFRF